ncbi:hypothetical protein E2C01_032635 [Portunus trituberculatus]|uniref:Uncharacterized protein n=1 Tax=Portunus trituberculatus TaxID=210409 RepID=A0A5B7F3C1_PORTR|nr:hypothetical protein [Portunus trituberculatus]
MHRVFCIRKEERKKTEHEEEEQEEDEEKERKKINENFNKRTFSPTTQPIVNTRMKRTCNDKVSVSILCGPLIKVPCPRSAPRVSATVQITTVTH